jgi:tRNA-Thr(GGU) m(6)t(6)A37 methyltransferase TsaA
MSSQEHYELEPIGWVRSSLLDPGQAPLQGDEGAPDAQLALDDAVREAARDLAPGDELLVLTWLHRGRRDVLAVHPRGDPANPMRGVFSTRSPDRPNPIGLHRVTVLAVAGATITVSGLEAIDGTPVIDIKPVLEPIGDR